MIGFYQVWLPLMTEILKNVFLFGLYIWIHRIRFKWSRNTFKKCDKNGFEHDIVDYYRVFKGKAYHSGTQK